MATPQIERYGLKHKVCFPPDKSVYMNYNGYTFDFECDKPEPEEPEEPEEKDKPKKDENVKK